MNYAVFRSAVLGLLEEDREWSVKTDWEEEPAEYPRIQSGSSEEEIPPEDFIELEQEKGPFYVFMTVSVNRLFMSYQEEGWDAVTRELEKYTRRDSRGSRRARGIDYEARLNEEGVELYGQLRALRAEIAGSRNLPPYFIFLNRTLYEMCCKLPSDMAQMRALYGVGEKNSQAYGKAFLDKILEFTKGRKNNYLKVSFDEESGI